MYLRSNTMKDRMWGLLLLVLFAGPLLLAAWLNSIGYEIEPTAEEVQCVRNGGSQYECTGESPAHWRGN